ncbi:MAG TPA: T9SS type A sorting domain-containing protein [Candidatus Kapabacteria bacterium]|nr:T9SS type A sorting domain-containing protein [Candidatus Kapabacteria bacterium]
MGRKIIILIWSLLLYSELFSQNEPSFIWEKEIELNFNFSPFYYTAAKIDDNIYMWLEGRDKTDHLKSAALIKSDLNGNLFYKNFFRRLNEYIFSPTYFLKHKDSIKLRGIFLWAIDSRGLSQYHQINIKENGQVSNFSVDSINAKLFGNPAYANSINDSIYIGAWYRYKQEDAQKILVFNNDGTYIRSLAIDTTGFIDSLQYVQQHYKLFPTNDGNFISFMYSPFDYKCGEYGCIDFAYFCKFNFDGKLIWKTNLGNEGFKRIHIYCTHQTKDSSFFVMGRVFNSGIDNAFYFAKINSKGEKLWSKIINYTFPRIMFNTDIGFTPLRNGSFYSIYGHIQTPIKGNPDASTFWLMNVDSSGNVVEEYKWTTKTLLNRIKSVIELDNGNLFLVGHDGSNFLYLAEIKPKLLTTINEQVLNDFKEDNIIINNFSNQEMIKIHLLDDNGISIYECQLMDIYGNILNKFTMKQDIELDTKTLNSGVYFIHFKDKSEQISSKSSFIKKLILLK